jgi:hypothetical protein
MCMDSRILFILVFSPQIVNQFYVKDSMKLFISAHDNFYFQMFCNTFLLQNTYAYTCLVLPSNNVGEFAAWLYELGFILILSSINSTVTILVVGPHSIKK